MGEREKDYSTDSISGIILNAANKARQKDIDMEEAIAAAKRLLEEAQIREQEAIERSFEDPLTHCLNRNYFIKFLKENFDSNRDDGNIGLVFVDVNELKQTNDTQGHAAGDRVLQSMAKLLKSGTRKSGSTVIHLHGDEFVIISKRCDDKKRPEGAGGEQEVSFEDSLEMMMQRLETKAKSSGIPFGFSYGIAIYGRALDEQIPTVIEPSPGIESLGDISKLTHTLIRADNNMYQHKTRHSQA